MPKYLALKNYLQETRLFNHRMLVATAIIILFVFAVISRLFYLQVMQHDLYTTLSDQNQLSVIPIGPKRGLIFDRNGVLLAENIPIFNLEITKESVPNLKQTIDELKKIINISDADVESFYKQMRMSRHFLGIPLKIRLTEREVAIFEVNKFRFPGVQIQTRLMRHYPLGEDTSQAVGYIGRINTKELNEVDSSNYSDTEYIGKLGIEKFYENILHGETGYAKVESDANGRMVRSLHRQAPIPGENIYLTIDSKLEKIAKDAFEDNAGALVAIDPNTGQILAMVSTPGFDPNLFVRGISQQDYQALQQAPLHPLFNRSIRGQYPFGSTIKPFIALEGLRTKTITPEYAIPDPGYYKLKNSSHPYHDYLKGGHGGAINLTQAITVSCDIYFYNLAVKLGIRNIDHVLKEFGFGELTQIDLHEELSGNVPTPEWKIRKYKTPWYPGDTVISGIGQGFMLTTPLQLASAVGAIATEGERMKPYLLLKQVKPNGQIYMTKPELVATIDADEEDWQTVRNAMLQVVASPRGTARSISQNLSYSIAGKTGTAQVFSKTKTMQDKDSDTPFELRDHSLFIGFAPFDRPQIAVAVIAEHHHGFAPHVARKVFDYYLKSELHHE